MEIVELPVQVLRFAPQESVPIAQRIKLEPLALVSVQPITVIVEHLFLQDVTLPFSQMSITAESVQLFASPLTTLLLVPMESAL